MTSVEQEHIIHQNEKLISELSQVRDRLGKATERNRELEKELGTRETQVTYMRGVMKNLVSIHEGHEVCAVIAIGLLKHHSSLEKILTRYCSELYRTVAIALSVLGPALVAIFTSESWVIAYYLMAATLGLWFAVGRMSDLRNRAIVSTRGVRQIIANEGARMERKRKELKDVLTKSDLMNAYVDNI